MMIAPREVRNCSVYTHWVIRLERAILLEGPGNGEARAYFCDHGSNH